MINTLLNKGIIKYNPNKEIVKSIQESLIKTNGYCPCIPKNIRNSDNICPCKDLRIENKCRCGLFIN